MKAALIALLLTGCQYVSDAVVDAPQNYVCAGPQLDQVERETKICRLGSPTHYCFETALIRNCERKS
jgi:hypothetical protein